MSDQLFRLIDEKFITGWSAGFKPVKGYVDVLSEPMLKSRRGSYRFNKWELFEYSLTPVPVNAEALTIKIEKSMSSYDPLIVERLRPYLLSASRSSVIVPGHQLVNKSMNENANVGGAMSEDMSAPTDTPKSPAVQAAYTMAQGLNDVCMTVDQLVSQSDNPKFKKLLSKLCDEAKKLGAKAQQHADKMESMLSSNEDNEDLENEAAESPESETVEAESPDVDDTGSVVTKSGWRPERFILKSMIGNESGQEVLTPEFKAQIEKLASNHAKALKVIKRMKE
jgi:hypothetical protein